MSLLIQRRAGASVTDEYGTRFRRLYPWKGVADSPWGSAWAAVAPGASSHLHGHDEEETFIVLKGSGTMQVDGQAESVAAGDVIYLPRFSEHTLRNDGAGDLEFLCIWWGAPESPAAS
ncbi:MAG: hypothetical protein JWM87_3438 [Candidatus Eremiobacteraeota bacterium]|nr:hypothetical protein [Candidatus Eremiobacteraeota bacterium]